MPSKLTILLDKNLIDQAKVYAKKKGRSLSDIIESYLKGVIESGKPSIEISPEIRKLQGSVKLPDNFDYKKELQKSLNSKYQL